MTSILAVVAVVAVGAQLLNDLLDVTIDITRTTPEELPTGFALVEGQVLQYDGAGQWRNSSRIDCGTF